MMISSIDRRTVAHLAAIGLVLSLIGIGVGSLAPSLAPPGQGHADKFVHVAGYAVPGLFAALAARTRPALLALVLLIWIYGGVIEVAQSFMPPRMGSLFDAAANALGAALGAVLGSALAKLGRRAG